MDDADRAELAQERELERIVSAARGIRPIPGTHCRDCDEDLPEHRRHYGICWACQARIKAQARRMTASTDHMGKTHGAVAVLAEADPYPIPAGAVVIHGRGVWPVLTGPMGRWYQQGSARRDGTDSYGERL